MPITLGRNEVKARALEFSRKWTGETRERAEASSFWKDFFQVFGIDPLSMPQILSKAHQALDKAVDAAYGFKGKTDAERVAFLFGFYQKYTSLLPVEKTKKARATKAKPKSLDEKIA
jgi:hypothetical protein